MLEPWVRYGFRPNDFSIIPFSETLVNGHEVVLTNTPVGPFGMDSIMMYDSHAFANAEAHAGQVRYAPLVKWKRGHAGYYLPFIATEDNAGFVPKRMVKHPSQGD